MKGIIFLGVFLISIFGIQAQNVSLDPHLLELLEYGNTEAVIVKMRDYRALQVPAKSLSKTTKGTQVYNQLVANTKRSQKDIKSYLTNLGIEFKVFNIVNAISLKANKTLIDALLKREDVEHISWNPETELSYMVEVPRVENRDVEPEWGIKMIQADIIWEMGYKGKGAVIAGQDTGYDFEHPSF